MPLTTRYTSLNGVVYSEDRDGTVRDYRHDTLGSVVATTSGSTVSDVTTYWPYGEVRTGPATTAYPFRFVGSLGYYQDTAKRTYVRARHYRQDLGRWLTVDPLWPEEEPYTYSRAAPTFATDPTGMATYLCRRPVILNACAPEDSHWWLSTGEPGCAGIGLGPAGTAAGVLGRPEGSDFRGTNLDNMRNYGVGSVTCINISNDAMVEKCLCKNFKAIALGNLKGKPPKLCGRTWTGACYHVLQQNCQDFVQCLLEKCIGGKSNWRQLRDRVDLFESWSWEVTGPPIRWH